MGKSDLVCHQAKTIQYTAGSGPPEPKIPAGSTFCTFI
jgi:hypothetical protein